MEKYKGVIDIKCGLELEYFPKYNSYYEWLNGKAGLDGIILGQHMYSMPDGRYSFSLTPEELLLSEADGLAELEVLGILSGYFKVVAHPDRCFRRQTLWTEKAERLSKDIIKAAVDHNIPLKKNISSIRVTERYNLHHFWKQFWEMTPPELKYLYGLDAHSCYYLENGFLEYQKPLIEEEKNKKED